MPPGEKAIVQAVTGAGAGIVTGLSNNLSAPHTRSVITNSAGLFTHTTAHAMKQGHKSLIPALGLGASAVAAPVVAATVAAAPFVIGAAVIGGAAFGLYKLFKD